MIRCQASRPGTSRDPLRHLVNRGARTQIAKQQRIAHFDGACVCDLVPCTAIRTMACIQLESALLDGLDDPRRMFGEVRKGLVVRSLSKGGLPLVDAQIATGAPRRQGDELIARDRQCQCAADATRRLTTTFSVISPIVFEEE